LIVFDRKYHSPSSRADEQKMMMFFFRRETRCHGFAIFRSISSPAAALITGAALLVDGGWTAQ
jgi:hypothetical protein